MKKFNVILADPPWLFKTRSPKGEGKSAQRHYDCMSIEDIAALDVLKYAADDCALLMWTTWPVLVGNYASSFVAHTHWPTNPVNYVAKAWGFEPSGLAWEWFKFNFDTGKAAFGGGYGTRKNVEPCLLYRRGSPILKTRSERDHIFSPRREHSRKPDEQYEKIERMYDGPYLELFSRTKRKGWTTKFSNEKGKFDAE